MKNKEKTLNTMFSTIDKTMVIKQPKLLKINNNYNNNTNNEIINNQLKNEREKLKQNIINENIKYSNIKKPFENYSNFDKKILNYHKYSFNYIDYLLEKFFQSKYISQPSDNLIKQSNQKNFDDLMKNLEKNFEKFTNKQKLFLSKNKNIKNKNKIIKNENENIESEPLFKDENLYEIFTKPSLEKFGSIINSSPDVQNEILNEPDSNFYREKIGYDLIKCLDNKNLNVPNKNFIESENKKFDRDFICENKKYFNIERNKIKCENEYENNICNNMKKTVEMQNKIFNEIYENNKNLSKIDFNEDWFNFLDFIKKNMIKNKMFENLTISDLKILKLPLDQLKNKLNNNDKNNNKIPIFQNENEINNIKNNKLNEIDDEEKKINDDIENVLLKYGKDIQQFKSQNKNSFNNNNINDNIIEKMWNETKNIENRTFYNDNPYHYGYNYEGSSIDIKKFITKTTSFNNNNNNNNNKNNIKNNKKKITKSSSKKIFKKNLI